MISVNAETSPRSTVPRQLMVVKVRAANPSYPGVGVPGFQIAMVIGWEMDA